MGKSKKQQAEAYQYDEASSGSDDSDSSDDENDDEYMSTNSSMAGARRKSEKKFESDEIESDSNEEEEENGSSDQDDSSDDDSEEEGCGARESDDPEDGSSDDDSEGPGEDQDADHDESSSDEEDVPLHERLLKTENRGRRKPTSRREQKSRALEEATKRLASFKEEKQRKKRKQMREDDENEGDKHRKRSASSRPTDAATKTKKKKNKHKPTEVSSKRADFFGRGARRLNESGLGVDIGAHRYKPMDPRLSTLSGHFDEDRFHSNYEFLEEIRNQEIGQVRKRIAAHRATGNKGNRMRRKLGITQADGSHSSTLEEDVGRLKSLTQARADLERRKIDRAAKQSVKRKIREDVESGKSGAYYLKRKEKKKLELEARFEEIRKRKGEKGVEKILEKKRKKNKSRDASFLSR